MPEVFRMKRTGGTLKFRRKAVLEYLDAMIGIWRARRDESGGGEAYQLAVHYVDAYQSVRSSLFGSTLPLETREQ